MTNSKVLEFFGFPTFVRRSKAQWGEALDGQICTYTGKKCYKIRKSQPDISIGTCSVCYGRDKKDVIICPDRLVQQNKIFVDCIHLLTRHEPGNEFHIVPEVTVPGGSVDFFLISARRGKVVDFVGIELQTLDTTGTVWPQRQLFLKENGFAINEDQQALTKTFGMNWKMTAKTILVQLHHKVETFEALHKNLVLVVQDHLMAYMQKEFSFDHIDAANVSDSMHFHSYSLEKNNTGYELEMQSRHSTDANGIAECLGLQADANIDFGSLVALLETKISPATLLTI